MKQGIAIQTGRIVYSLALFVYAWEQFYFGTFRNVFLSPWQEYLPWLRVWAFLYGGYLFFTGAMILLNRNARKWATILGVILLVTFLFIHIPNKYFYDSANFPVIGQWVNELKCFALSGGAFVVAYSFGSGLLPAKTPKWMEAIIPYGNLFFLFVMTCFGICHILYAQHLQNLVPEWLPARKMWVYFTGVALIGSGVGIALGIRIRIIAILQSIMIFSWFWLVHLPGTIKFPLERRGELLSALLDCLAFSGIALLIAMTMRSQKWVNDLIRTAKKVKAGVAPDISSTHH